MDPVLTYEYMFFKYNIITHGITLVYVFWHLVFHAWLLGCWTLNLWVVHPAWLTWTKSTPTVSTPVWPSRTSHPKYPLIPNFRTWLVPTLPLTSPPARHLCSTSILLVPTPVKAWAWVDPRCSTRSYLACTAAWSPCLSRWACLPVRDILPWRCRKRRGVQEHGEVEAGHPSISQMGRSHHRKYLITIPSFVYVVFLPLEKEDSVGYSPLID